MSSLNINQTILKVCMKCTQFIRIHQSMTNNIAIILSSTLLLLLADVRITAMLVMR